MNGYDLVLKKGLLFLSEEKRFLKGDLAVKDGRVAARAPDLGAAEAGRTIDAEGALVVPGLVDLHTHVYWGGTPLGVNPDKLAPASGVTTWVDFGSAGAGNFEGFYHHVLRRSSLRIFAFLNLSYIGLVSVGDTRLRFGELFDERLADARALARTVEAYGSVVKGIKLRIGPESSLLHGFALLETAIALGERLGLPVAVHATSSPPATSRVLSLLRRGDVFTHCYASSETSGLLDREARLLEEARLARERGVLFDLGHGARSFSFGTAERALELGFPPDFVSTDLHAYSFGVPVLDLPETIAKLVLLGLPLEEALCRATLAPAAFLGIDGEAGSVEPGRPADLAVLRWADGEVDFFDGGGEVRRGKTLRAEATIVAGRVLEPFQDDRAEGKWKPGLVAGKKPAEGGGGR